MRFFCSIVIIFLSISEVQALSLKDALVSTYNTNPDLIAKREELKSVDEKMYEAVSGFLPKLSYQHNNQYRKTFEPTEVKQREKTNVLELKQNLFQGGGSLAAIETAKYTIESERVALSSFEMEILMKAVKAYSDVYFNKQTIEVYRQNFEDLKKHLESTKDRFESGVATRTDVAQSERGLAMAERDLIVAEGEYLASVASFQKVIGVEPQDIEPITQPENLPKNLKEVVDLASKNNPNILSAKYNQSASEVGIKSAVSVMWPKLDLVGQEVRDSISSVAQKSGSYRSVNLVLNVPIYQQGIEYSNLRKARAVNAASRYRMASTADAVKEISIRVWSAHQAAKSSLVAADKAYKAAKVALDGITQEYNEGLKSLTDLLELRSQTIDSQIKKLMAAKEEVVTSYNILAVTGNLTAKHLKLPTKYYDPTENYDKNKLKLIGF